MTTVIDDKETTETLSPPVASITDEPQEPPRFLAALKKAGERLAENAPPLTSEQVDRIVAILRMSEVDEAEQRETA